MGNLKSLKSALCAKILSYKSVDSLQLRCMCIAVTHFLLYLLLYITLSFLSTLMQFADNADAEELFISKFEKYYVLGNAIYMLAPFISSSMLIFGLLNHNQYCINACLRCSAIFTIVLCACQFSIGIFFIVEGTLYVGCTSVVFSIILGSFMAFSILQIFELVEAYEVQKRKSDTSYSSTTSTAPDTNKLEV